MSHNHDKYQDKTPGGQKPDLQPDDENEMTDDISMPDDGQDTPGSGDNADGSDTLMQQLEDARAQVEKEKKEYLFLMAEFDNFRKRTVKEKSDLIKNAAEKVFKDLLPIVDDFERGLEASAQCDDADSVRQGMELIYQKLIKYLAVNGVKAIESNGRPFDAELHEAIAMVPATDESMKGIVIDTLTKGYTINDKVLRHAKVAVGQ